MKITIDLGNIFKKEFWNRLDFIGALIILLAGILWVFIIPLILSVIILIFPETSWISSLSDFWKPISAKDFILFNAYLMLILCFSWFIDLIEGSDLEEETFINTFSSALVAFSAQELNFRYFEFSDNLPWNIFLYFPTIMFLLKIQFRRTIQIKSMLNSNADMLRKLTRTDEELRLKILEKKLKDLIK